MTDIDTLLRPAPVSARPVTDEHRSIGAFLRGLPVFRNLSEESAGKLASRLEVKRFSPGTVIIEKGAPGDAMYVVKQGSVQVPIASDDGRRVTVYLGPGDFFGEMALMTGEARRADVIADGEVDCECLVFGKAEVAALLKQEPRIARFLTEILGKRLLSSGQMKRVGKYQLLGELGRGGGAIVYEGFHPGLQRPVAVKMLSHDLVYEGEFAERFVHEAQLIADLRHDNIVQVYDIERAYATFFIVMERLDGTELKRIVDEGPSSPEETRHILRQVARALQYAHKSGVVHQDVKPSNVFVESTGRVKLMDFGIAGAPSRDGQAASEGVMGTPGYIAPEVMRGGAVDGRADIYALGVVAYEMLTGRVAFDSSSKVQVLKKQLATARLELPPDIAALDAALAEFVARATALDPAERFATCGEVLEHLDEATPAHLAPDRAEGLVLSFFFDRKDRTQVEEILGELADRLSAVRGARVAIAEVKPLDG